MTAIVGILNKRAVAIAADSAVTVNTDNGTKIYNTSQKIFHISCKNPVALMVYSSASFMSTPWDVIIDLYTKERGNKSFSKVSEYCEDFLDFIRKNDLFSSNDALKWYFLMELRTIYDKVFSATKARAEEDLASFKNPSEEQSAVVYKKHQADVLRDLKELCDGEGKADVFNNYSFKKYQKYTKNYWDEFIEIYLDGQDDNNIKSLLEKPVYDYLTSKLFYNDTGLVFVGYGDKDIFPSIHAITISGIIDGIIRYFVDYHEDISINNSSLIKPFAQDDVMMTMMKGIAPAFYGEVVDGNEIALSKYKESIVEKLTGAGVPDEIIENIKDTSIEGFVKEYQEKLDTFMDQNYIDGIVNAVDCFNVADMTNMAESLISITNLQRHFSSSEESVGGPVEVAVITKSEGFKWVKHKQF